ncbi:protein ENHANCED DISEASE RESISTANCE 2-like isoform X2 [Impatiens glandulifera]|uniref:protein ENHANCED DISEASE RESISTANCE 2-like isoform X2 n=1 Tax=Impatiens glandulifera TaxID=253017 RepID=UPI001FB1825C|nr:protein ENHANCED DISEASE RESISTANCE 2-like isoform X2 [Impatiens glandulifera]
MASPLPPSPASLHLKKVSSEGASSESLGSESPGEEFEFSGWVYHIRISSLGHEACHLRFLRIRGKYVEMFKRDPSQDPGNNPIRRGIVGRTLMVEEFGRRKLNDVDFYVLRIFNRLDQTKKGEIACSSVGDAHKWMEAFDHAKQLAEYDLSRSGSSRNKLNMENEIDLEGHRPRVRRYAHGFKKLIRIGRGPESLLHQSTNLANKGGSTDFGGNGSGDVIEAHEWKCVRTVNGIRIFEDVSDPKNGKAVIVKAVAVLEASADTAFEVITNLDRRQRYEWDTLMDDLKLVESLDGHFDVIYGKHDSRYLGRCQSKKDFVFSRQWFRGQDGTYTILHFPTVDKKCPPKPGYRRIKINPSTWEIRSLKTKATSNGARCLVTQMLEMKTVGRFKWRSNPYSSFEKSISYALLSQVAGLKEYIGANPGLTSASATVVSSKYSDGNLSSGEYADDEVADQFYDAMSTDSSSSDEDVEDEVDKDRKDIKIKLRNVSWAIAGLALRRNSAKDLGTELDLNVSPAILDPSQYHGTMRQGKDDNDYNSWTSPNGAGFMIRGKTYLKDNAKVMGGDPLFKLISVDWFKVEKPFSRVALHSSSLVQVPAKPNYSLVLYYAADRPINKNSLLGKFVDGNDLFRDSRLKLIPRIVEGYWMVKRAVGTKACLLGKAVTCEYLRKDNFLEIDVDIGSSSVARSVIGLVLGYVTSLVVDLAILIEGKEEAELPEYLLGTVRLNRVRLDTAQALDI